MTSPRIAPSSFSSEANCLFAYAKVRYFTGMWQKKTRYEPSGILLALRSSPEYRSVPFMRGDAWKGMSGCPLVRRLSYNSFRVYRLYEHDDRAQRKSLAVLLVACPGRREQCAQIRLNRLRLVPKLQRSGTT